MIVIVVIFRWYGRRNEWILSFGCGLFILLLFENECEEELLKIMVIDVDL